MTTTTATVDLHHFHPDSLPLIDLRLLSQSDLLSVSHSFSRTTSAAQNDYEDEVSTPKIDRSVFNESAGSRKQTFSRFRLAPRNSSQILTEFSSVAPLETLDEDNSEVISLLKSLFKIQSHSSFTIGNNGQLIPVKIHYKDYLNATWDSNENKGLHDVPIDVVSFSVKKRKRGRPRKDENRGGDSCSLIESGVKVNETKVNIPVNVLACEIIKRRPGRPRKDADSSRHEYRAVESESKLNESKGESNEAMVTLPVFESLQDIPVNIFDCDSGKRKPGRPRKDENRNIHEYRIIQSESKVNESTVERSEARVTVAGVESLQNIPVNVFACESGKRRLWQLREDENRIRNEYSVIETECLVKENGAESNEIKATLGNVESSQNVSVNVASCEIIKRKRGRPRKDDYRNQNQRLVGSENKVIQSASKSKEDITVIENKDGKKETDMVRENRDGVVVDFVTLGTVKDPFAEELRRRTAGIVKQEDLFGYLSGLKGDWVSRSQKWKIVDASEYGDALPRGWKLMLCIRKKVGHAWLACRRYISPNGRQFASCKEVSSYLLSFFGIKDASQSSAGGVLMTQKNNEPVAVGVPSEFLERQETVGVDWGSFAEKPSNCRGNNETSSALPHSKPKAYGIVEPHSDKYVQDDQVMMSNRNVQTLILKNCVKQDTVFGITNDKVDKVKIATDISAAKPDVCLGAGTVLSTDYRSKSREFPGEKDVPKSNIGGINNFGWQGRSPQNWSLAPSGNNQPHFVDYIMKDVPIGSMDKQRKEVGSESSFFPSSGKDKIVSCENLEERCFTITMQGGETYRNKHARNEAISRSDYQGTGLENSVTNVKEQGKFKGRLPVPMEQRSSSQSHMYGVSTSMLTEARRERGPASGLPNSSGSKSTYFVNNYMNNVSTPMLNQPKFDDVIRSENYGLSFGFGNKHTISKPRQEEDSEVGLLNLFGTGKFFGFDDGLTKASAGTTEFPKLDQVRNANEQVHGVENNYRVYTDNVQQELRLENSENVRNNEFMSAFSNHARSNVDAMAEFLWRTDESNILLSGLGDSSSRLLQSSGCFPSFGTMSDKGENELFSIGEKYDSISGFEGLRSGGMEHMEYDFLATQTSSQSQVPKVLSYDAEISRGFDSSVWLEKEALPLLPKIGNRYQVATLCAWCRNEFHHEPVDTEAETGAVGFMCPTCKAKFSSNHNSL
ncbi:uncharacterized protein LOC123203577 [Mangifera indica]|uniref:uncharacterized protein LOC123203577 n=1 Tax=Mangifera indica TaxID=29780 RepID=UPI001CF95469|nr:uncharacterized protein LOC123203577 [Mangifera indica]